MANVSPETRRKVVEAAHDLAYPSEGPETGGAPGSRRSVAVIVPYIGRWFFGTVTAAAVTTLHQLGYDAVLYHLGRADIRDRFFERMPLARRVAGILTLSMPLTEEHTLSLRALGLPLVSVGSIIPGSASVGVDDVAAAQGAVNHLLHLRHRRIGLIAAEADDPGFAFVSSARRRLGWTRSLETAGVPIDESLIASGPHGVDGGAAAMARLLTGHVLPTAVFAEYDELAIGAISTIRRAGLHVPGDISVIGMDDHEMSAMFNLTTIAQDPVAQGQTAAQLLIDILETESGAADMHSVVLPTQLILRDTTARPPLASAELTPQPSTDATPDTAAQRP